MIENINDVLAEKIANNKWIDACFMIRNSLPIDLYQQNIARENYKIIDKDIIVKIYRKFPVILFRNLLPIVDDDYMFEEIIMGFPWRKIGDGFIKNPSYAFHNKFEYRWEYLIDVIEKRWCYVK